jgi:hypothetical protein
VSATFVCSKGNTYPPLPRSVFLLLMAKTILFAGLASQYGPMEEPVPYIFAAVAALALISLKTRRAWWFALLVEVLTLLGGGGTLAGSLNQGSYYNTRKFLGAAVVLVALAAIVLLLRRSVRDWYRSRVSSASSTS